MMGATFCDEYVFLFVCLLACPLAHLRNHTTEHVVRGRGSVGPPLYDVAIREVLPVLWMTSRFHTMGSTARRVSRNYYTESNQNNFAEQ